MCTFWNGLTQDENLHIYLLFFIYINSHNHVFKLLDHMLRFFSQENLILQDIIKSSTLFIHKCIVKIFSGTYVSQSFTKIKHKCFRIIYNSLFQACCKISILIVKSYTKCTQNISSKVPSIKIFCNNKSLYLFLTYWISVMVNLK